MNWLEVRAQAQLELGKGIPLLPNPAAGGGWSKVPISCEIAGDWLRALLKDVPSPKKGVRIATHSCKSSMLSMCAKYGMEPSARRMLGYHSAGRDRSMLVYSRDSAAGPLRDLCGMLQKIREGKFLPDESRSGRFVDLEPNAEPQGDDDDGQSSSTATEDEEDIDCEGDEEACGKVIGPWQPEKSFGSRCIHVMADEAGAEFRCGRRMSVSYDVLATKPTFFSPACNVCFKAA